MLNMVRTLSPVNHGDDLKMVFHSIGLILNIRGILSGKQFVKTSR